MPSVNVTEDEVIALGKKLDEFAEVLTERERAMLLTMIGAARAFFLSKATPAPAPKTPMLLPKLGPAFDAAFLPGRAAEFTGQAEDVGALTVSTSTSTGPSGPSGTVGVGGSIKI